MLNKVKECYLLRENYSTLWTHFNVENAKGHGEDIYYMNRFLNAGRKVQKKQMLGHRNGSTQDIPMLSDCYQFPKFPKV